MVKEVKCFKYDTVASCGTVSKWNYHIENERKPGERKTTVNLPDKKRSSCSDSTRTLKDLILSCIKS